MAGLLLTCWGCFSDDTVTGPLPAAPNLPSESRTPYVFIDRLYDYSLSRDPEYRGSTILNTSRDDFEDNLFSTKPLRDETAPLSVNVFRITSEGTGFRSIRFVSDVVIPATGFDTMSFGARGTTTDANILIGEGARDKFLTFYGYTNNQQWHTITIPLSNLYTLYTFNIGDRIIAINPNSSDPVGSYLEIANVIFRLSEATNGLLIVPNLPADSLTPYVFVDGLYDDTLYVDTNYRGSAILKTSRDDFKDPGVDFTTKKLKNEDAPLSTIVLRITAGSNTGFRSIRFVSDVAISATGFDTVSFGARGTTTDANILIGEGEQMNLLANYGYMNDENWHPITIPLSNSYTFNVGSRVVGITPNGSDPVGSYLEVANVIFQLSRE